MSEQFTVTLPDIGEGVVEGEVVEWLKKEGDSLLQDEPVVMVMTDKATVELPAPYPGVLSKQYVQKGGIAHKGKPLYDISIEKSTLQQPTAPSFTQELSSQKAEKEKEAESSKPPHHAGLALPSTRKLAHELGVSLEDLEGTGKEGRITVEDVRNALEGRSPNKSKGPLPRMEGDQEQPWIGIRRLMAEKMVESKHMAPHFSYFEQVDAARLMQLRDTFKAEGAKQGITVSFMPFILKGLSLCMQQFPWINSSIDPDAKHLIIHKHQNIGVAMATDLGLIVPILKDVETKSLIDLVHGFEDLKKRAKENHLLPEDMKGATITISNFGVLGGNGLWATPILNYPEVAILALAKIQKQPFVKNDELVARDVLNLSWSFDHRVIDGHLAAQVSNYFCSLMRDPAKLL